MTLISPARVPVTAGTWRWGEGQQFFVEADRLVRTPIATSRRVGVLSLVGGAGASSVAAGVAMLSARRRSSPVLAVDAAGAQYGLGHQLGHRGVDTVTNVETLAADPQSFAEASFPLARSGSLHYLGLGHPHSASWPADSREWHASVAPIGRFFPVVITDWGRRRDLRAIADIARASHSVCLIAPADRTGLEQVAALVPALRHEPASADVVVVLVDRSGDGAGASRIHLGNLDAPVLRVGFDSALSQGSAPRRRTRAALLQVAAVLIGGTVQAADVGVIR